MVASAVLVLLVLLVAQLVNSTNAAINLSGRHISADDQARVIFDRMAKDFAGLPKRKDIDYSYFTKSTGNDSMFFYSEAPAFFDAGPASSSQSTMALVGYCINPANQLLRLGIGLTWDGSLSVSGSSVTSGGMTFLPSALSGSVPLATGTTSSPVQDFHVIGDGVFRLEFCYQLKDGSFSNSPVLASLGDTTTIITGQPTNSTGTLIGLQDVSAIVVAIAILDTNSRKLTTTAGIGTLASGLVDSGTAGPPSQAWETNMSSLYSGAAGMPAASAQQVRLYQRFFYLNTQ